MDLPNLQMKMKLHIEGNVFLQGDYKVDGKVLVLPIQGSGRCNITLGKLYDALILFYFFTGFYLYCNK